MLTGMTGFASTTIVLSTDFGDIPAVLTVKTLNNKFIEISCKFPHALAELEPEVIRRCKNTFGRGSVYVSLYITQPQTLKTSISTSYPLAEKYVAEIQALQEKLKLPGAFTVSDLVQLPHLFEVTEQTNLTGNTSHILDTLDSLIQSVQNIRQHEGAALLKDIEERVACIQQQFGTIEPRLLAIETQRRERILKDLKGLFPPAPGHVMDEAETKSLLQHVEKFDVHEELVRFQYHLHTFLQNIHNKEPQKGKQLDFILQELFREINTTNAKLPDAPISTTTIAIRTELEKIRQQVQNVV